MYRMPDWTKRLLFLYVCLAATNANDLSTIHSTIRSTLIEEPAKFYLTKDDTKSATDVPYPILAEAFFADNIKKIGWTVQTVKTTAYFPDKHQAYWAGYLETFTSYNLTKAYWNISYGSFCNKPFSADCQKLQTYLQQNLDYMIRTSTQRGLTDPFWHQIELLLWQTKGVADAFEKRFVSSADQLNTDYLLTLKDDAMSSYLLQIAGDLEELIPALRLETLRTVKDVYGERRSVFAPTCSALIKLAPDNKDVYLSHVSWNTYQSMLRVLKHYDMPWRINPAKRDISRVAARSMSFSSYPSMISSMDDFYILSSKIVAIETTNGIMNDELNKLIQEAHNNSVPESFRVMTANRLATNGKEWVDIFSQQNSGTYNNQWMIFDANQFKPGQELNDTGVLTVAEQIPGLVESDDLTKVLKEQTYWASYNVPYFPKIFNLSGYADAVLQYGDWYDHDKTARAKIFRRDHKNVKSLADMCQLMGSNDFKNDPFAACECQPPFTAENAIAARCDLNDPNGTYPIHAFGYRLHGAIDFKVTDFRLLSDMSFVARSGPTYDNQPAFNWEKLPIPVPTPPMHPVEWRFPVVRTLFRREGMEKTAVFTITPAHSSLIFS